MVKITRGEIQSPLKGVIYGPEGIGKSTFAAAFPGALFIDTEGSTNYLDVARTQRPTSWGELCQQVNDIAAQPGLCQTLVIDTADWAEALCVQFLCESYRKTGLEEFGYGKGYVYLAEEFGRLLMSLEAVLQSGVNVLFTAHAKMRKFEQPEEMGAYDRWEMKLSKQVAPLLKEWADMVLFANYKTIVVKSSDGKAKVQGGKRVLYTSHHPCWDAKNRQGLPEELPLDFSSIAHAIHVVEAKETAKSEVSSAAQERVRVQSTGASPANIARTLPLDLQRLMDRDGISALEVQRAVAKKGWYPENMPIYKYDPAFISQALVGTWDRVAAMVASLREEDRKAADKDAQMINSAEDAPF